MYRLLKIKNPEEARRLADMVREVIAEHGILDSDDITLIGGNRQTADDDSIEFTVHVGKREWHARILTTDFDSELGRVRQSFGEWLTIMRP